MPNDMSVGPDETCQRLAKLHGLDHEKFCWWNAHGEGFVRNLAQDSNMLITRARDFGLLKIMKRAGF